MNQSTRNYHFKAGETIRTNEQSSVFADALCLLQELLTGHILPGAKVIASDSPT